MERLCTLNTTKRGHICSKASTKRLESCLEVVQGHTFWDHWKADEGLCITV